MSKAPLYRWIRLVVVVSALGLWLLHQNGVWPFSKQHTVYPSASTQSNQSTTASRSDPDSTDNRVAERIVGQLHLSPCELGSSDHPQYPSVDAYCTQLAVPENWDDPKGRSIDLHIAWLPAKTSQPLPDPLILLDGGPGGAATEDYPALAPAFAGILNQRSIVLMDQRGTGQSHPLHCTFKEFKNDNELYQSIDECKHSFSDGTQLAFYTTTQTTYDIDFIRNQLGIKQLNLYGVSYGTRVAQQYAMHFPNATRSVILDSAITNELALSQDHAINLDQALIQQFSRCQANADCKTHLGDTAQKMMTLKAQLAQPKTITFSDPWDQSSRSLTLSAAQFAQTIRFLSYNPDSAELIPYLVDEAYKGHWQPMATLMTLVGKSLAPIGRNDILELSVLCAEDADHLVLQPKDQSTLLGQSMVERLKKICTRWPKGTKPADFNAPFTGNIPTLILAGSDDPVTPVRYAHEIAAHLNHAKVIEFKGSGHTQVLSACGAPLIKKFLEQLNFSALPNACLDALGPPAPFQTINGPTP